MNNMKSCVIIFLACFLGIYSCNQKDKLFVEQMHEDIDYYFTTLKEVHPRPFYKYTEAQIDSVWSEIKEKCRKDISISQFHYTIAQANKYVDNHSKLIMDYSNSLGVTSWIDFSEKGMKLGDSVIQEINGIPAEEIAAIMEGVVVGDFPPDVRLLWKNNYLSSVLSGYYGYKFPYKIKLMDIKTNRIIDYTLDKTGNSHYAKLNYDPVYHSESYAQRIYEKESIGVFYFNTSEFYESTDGVEAVKKRLGDITSDFFKKVRDKKIRDIFIDVSQNSGGSIHANAYLKKHLTYEPYTVCHTSYVTPKGAEIFAEQTKTISDMDDIRKRIFNIAEKGGLKEIETIEGNNGFDGNVYVIMGSYTLSAGYSFCEDVKLAKAAILVGEIPSQHSPYTGNTLLFELPHFGIKFSCGSKFVETEPDVTNGKGFLYPDIPYKLDHPLNIDDYKKIIELNKK